MPSTTKLTLMLLGSACCFASPAEVAAQTVAAAAATPAELAADTESYDIEEIVVTSRLREERLQQVPLAISAYSAKQIDRVGIIDMSSLAAATAGLQLDSTGNKGTTSPVIRGLSQVSRIDDENNTPVFIDGVYVSGRDGIDASLLDIERIEVVKGPQSSLYGRNSYAGSINYITRKPGDRLQGLASVTVGNAARLTTKASVSGPLVPGLLYGRIAAAYDRWNGSYGNSNLRIGGYASKFFSGGLRLVVGERFEAVANVYYADDDLGPSPQIIFPGNCEFIRGKFGAFCGAFPEFKNPDMSGYDPRGYGTERQTMRSSLTMKLSLDGVTMTSITGYNTLKGRSLVDWDRQLNGVPYPFVLPNGTTGTVNLTGFLTGARPDNYDVSQEFRLESANGSPLQWLAGVSYYGFEGKADSPYGIDSSPAPAGARFTSLGATFFPGLLRLAPGPIDERLLTARFSKSIKETSSYAGFGAVQYTLADQITARAELRYTSEKKQLTQLTPVAPASRKTFTYWTPRFTLDYKPNANLLLYASAARGAKAGGFNSAAPTPAELPFGPEFNWTYEAGVKTDWFDNRLRVNFAVFNIDMKNIQITAASPSNPASFITQNAGTGRSRGFEVEVVARPIPAITLAGSYSLADAKFVKARDGSLRTYPSYLLAFDVSGNALPRQAKHLANLSAQYETEVADGWTGYIRADARYESQKNGFTVERLGFVEGRAIVNAKLGIIRGPVEGSLYVRNLLDDTTPLLANSSLTLNDAGRLPISVLPDLRTFGATLAYRF